MKADIHPTYHKAKVTCACGAKFELGSTLESYHVDICSQCHPFYTGKQKLVDTAGRVDKFKERQKAFEMKRAEEKARTGKKVKKETVEERVTRKAEEKEALKAAEKAKKEEEKKKVAKKQAEKVIVKKAEKKPAKKAEKAKKK
ncbi:50S ribosomal protein L31 [Candidatus Peregrinibacteria bacterium]|nr:50S ribosomal protein L31 [Candidatus Peregrinibacteria bacterium]